jgi:hypothetical protein
MFETIAVLGTLGIVVTFVVLFQIDRKARQEENEERSR